MKEIYSKCVKWRMVSLLLLVVAVIWTLELFSVQAMSFSYNASISMHKWVGAQAIRLLLNAAFSVGCVFLLPCGLTIAFFIGFIVFAQISVYYMAVFERALTWTTIQAQWSEGIVGAQLDWEYLNIPLLLAMLTTLAIKIFLLIWVKRKGRRSAMRWIGITAWFIYCLTTITVMNRFDPPRRLRTNILGDRFGFTYGFVLLWASEAVYLNQEQLLQGAVEQRVNVTDRLAELEPLLPLTGDVVILQVESLDWRLLNHYVNGEPVSPFLNRLADEAMLFKITDIHANGSGDADFIMLNAVPPSPVVMTYTLVHYPYRDTLPQLAACVGYTTAIFHGNTGNFYSRARAFQRMGFDELWFLEKLRDEGGLPLNRWDIRDDKVLAFSQKRLQEEHGMQRQLHYIITLTSHLPFTYLEPAEWTFLPEANNMLDRYFNSINFVDRHLEQYVDGLAQGTLVIIFGDHRAPVNYGAEGEYVPFIIHRVGERLAVRQASRTLPIAYSGELTLLDTASYVHRLFKQQDRKEIGVHE